MALVYCTKCGHKVSTTAPRCPGCGAPRYGSAPVARSTAAPVSAWHGHGEWGVFSQFVNSLELLITNPKLVIPSLFAWAAGIACVVVLVLAVLLMFWVASGLVWIASAAGAPRYMALSYAAAILGGVIVGSLLMPIPLALSAATMTLVRAVRSGLQMPVSQALGEALARRGAVRSFLVAFSCVSGATVLVLLVPAAGMLWHAVARSRGPDALLGQTAGVIFWSAAAFFLPFLVAAFLLFYAMPVIILQRAPFPRAFRSSLRLALAHPGVTVGTLTAICVTWFVVHALGFFLALAVGPLGGLVTLALDFGASAFYWVLLVDVFWVLSAGPVALLAPNRPQLESLRP